MKKHPKRSSNAFSRVVVRFRPQVKCEEGENVVKGVPVESTSSKSVELSSIVHNRRKTWKFGKFFKVLTQQEDNNDVYQQCLKSQFGMRNFGTLCVFTYGHSGAGKTHTLLGYGEEKGLFRQTLEDLCLLLKEEKESKLFLKVSFSEIHNSKVYDLLNNREECFVRTDSCGDVRIRSKTQKDSETGKVTVYPLTGWLVRTVEEALKAMTFGVDQRAVGNSTTHDQSSRSHAVISVEIVTKNLIQLREEIIVNESELVDCKMAMDEYKPSVRKRLEKQPGYVPRKLSHEDFAKLQQKEKKLEILIPSLKNKEKEMLETWRMDDKMTGSEVLFLDLAGSDYESVSNDLSEQEKREFREINSSLFALKECIRALNMKKTHIPWRNSRLTMLLKNPLKKKGCKVIMIANVSPSESQTSATVNTLKYANLLSKKK